MNKRITDIVRPYSENVYRGVNTDEDVKYNYFVWNYADDRGGNYADDKPQTEEIAVQVHWYVKKDFNFEKQKRELRKSFLAAGFTYPSVTELYENETGLRHIIFETEISVEMEE